MINECNFTYYISFITGFNNNTNKIVFYTLSYYLLLFMLCSVLCIVYKTYEYKSQEHDALISLALRDKIYFKPLKHFVSYF